MAVTETDLRISLRRWSDSLRLTGPVESAENVSLGSLQIDRLNGYYSFGYAYDTSETSRLLKRSFRFPDLGVVGHAVVFRQFDRFSEEDDPPEFMIGWVPDEQEAALDSWLDSLNTLLRESRRLRLNSNAAKA